MLPSKEHTFILQTVNTYYHGYVTSQYDITHCRACWRQILPINTWYYQSVLMPFIEHSALLLLEIQDPQLFECIFEVGFCVREGVKLCIAKEMEEQWRTGFQGEQQNLANTQKRQGLCLEGLTVSGQQNSVYETSEDGSGREEGGGKRWCDKHRCVPWRTAFLYCALSADCRGRGGFHLLGSMDRRQQETEQRNIVWNRYLRQDNEWMKYHFLLPQAGLAAWGKFDSWSPENTLLWASAEVLFFPPHSGKVCILTFPSSPLATIAVHKICHGVLSILELESDGFFCPPTVLSRREVPVFEGLGVTA